MLYIHFDGRNVWSTCFFFLPFWVLSRLFSLLLIIFFSLVCLPLSFCLSSFLFLLLVFLLWSQKKEKKERKVERTRERKKDEKKREQKKEREREIKKEKPGRIFDNVFFGGFLFLACLGPTAVIKTRQKHCKTRCFDIFLICVIVCCSLNKHTNKETKNKQINKERKTETNKQTNNNKTTTTTKPQLKKTTTAATTKPKQKQQKPKCNKSCKAQEKQEKTAAGGKQRLERHKVESGPPQTSKMDRRCFFWRRKKEKNHELARPLENQWFREIQGIPKKEKRLPKSVQGGGFPPFLGVPSCRERNFSPKFFWFWSPLGTWTSAPSGHGCPHRHACFSGISRAWPKLLPPDVRREVCVDVCRISGPKTYSLGCFFVLDQAVGEHKKAKKAQKHCVLKGSAKTRPLRLRAPLTASWRKPLEGWHLGLSFCLRLTAGNH